GRRRTEANGARTGPIGADALQGSTREGHVDASAVRGDCDVPRRRRPGPEIRSPSSEGPDALRVSFERIHEERSRGGGNEVRPRPSRIQRDEEIHVDQLTRIEPLEDGSV